MSKKIPKFRQTLFEKILQTYFPKDRMAQAGVFTSSLFLSHMSARQTVSLINRRLIENFKLNMYDIAIDPFDVKMGIGETTKYTQNDVDLYYAYNCAANFNGYTFFSPNTIASCMAMIFSVSVGDAFATIADEYDDPSWTSDLSDNYYRGAVYTIYFLTFLFV